MLQWIVSSSVLILIIIGMRSCLMGKITLRLQYSMWLLVAVRLLFPFSIGEAVLSVSTWLELAGDRTAVQEIVDFTQTPMQTMPYEDAYEIVADDYLNIGINIENLPEHVLSGTIENEVQNTMRGGYTLVEIARAIWIMGMVVLAVAFLFSNLCFWQRLRKCRSFLGKISTWIETKEKEAEILSVYQTEMVDTPCLYGIFHPVIYVTGDVMDQEMCMKHILAHEMTHYRHSDNIWSLIRVICLVIHWYNPLVWWAAMLSRNDAELACDEATIWLLGEAERASYGRTLIGLTCEKRSAILVTATTMTGSKKSIKERITLIAKKPKMAFFTLVMVIILILGAIVWTFAGEKRPYENFAEWADSINPEEVEYFHVHKGFGDNEIRYEATKEEFTEFLTLLQSIPEEDCYRRDTYADGYEDCFLYFLCGEDEVNLKCLEDKTVEYVYSRFAPQGRKLIIDSPKLWDYIVDMINEKGVPSSELSKDEPVVDGTMATICVYDTTADLNHDGYADYVEVLKTKRLDSMYNEDAYEIARIQVYLKKPSGGYENASVYISDLVGDTHIANGAYVLTKKDGKDYLLYSHFYESGGIAWYEYSVMYLQGTEMVAVQKEEIEFYTDPYRSGYWNVANREDVIPALKKDMEQWIENGIILASYDVSTPRFISTKGKEIPASTYYDLVWARNSDERLAQFENSIGKEKWMRDLYFVSGLTSRSEIREWMKETSLQDFSKWYTQYDGSKIQSINNAVRYKGVKYSDSILTNSETIYYRAEAGEDENDAIYKMIEWLVLERMVPSEDRTCTYVDYAIPKQKLVQISEHMWFVSALKGYYAFTGTDLVTMRELVMGGEPTTEDGLVAFVAQGSEEQFYHILIEKDGVYRLQRLDEMR